MRAIDLLDALGGVRGEYVMEAQRHREHKAVRRRRSPLKVLLVAAAMAALLAGCAYAVLRLQDLKMGMYQPVPLYEGETFSEEDLSYSVLSLQGYAGSPEYLASQEWREFESSYVADPSEILTTDGHDFFAPDRYDGYITYTQALMDKVDEICTKYGLDTLGKWWLEMDDTDFIFDAVGIPGVFLPDADGNMKWDGGDYYESGSFRVGGNLTTNEPDGVLPENTFLTYRCSMKGIFDGSYAIEKIEQCTDWEYRLKDGKKVLIVMNQEGGWIIADRKTCFITVWVHPEEPAGTQPNRQMMEALADQIDFDIQPHKIPIEVLNERERAYNAEIDKGLPMGLRDYDEAVAKIWSTYPYPEWLSYTLMDLDGNGTQELVVGQDGYVMAIRTLIDGEVYMLQDSYDIMPIFGGTPDYLYEGGVVGSPGHYFKMQPRLVPCDGEYQRLIVDMRPLSEYPLDSFPDMDPEYYERNYKNNKLKSYAEYIETILQSEHPDLSYYALYDLDGDGQEELIRYDEGLYWPELYGIYTMTDGHLAKVIFDCYPETVCENGVVESVIDCGQGNMVYRYFKLNGTRLVMVDYLRVDHGRNPSNPWFQSADASGQDRSLIPISQEEFNAIREKYRPLNLEMKPISEFPLE